MFVHETFLLHLNLALLHDVFSHRENMGPVKMLHDASNNVSVR